jgi:hypothetical protein
MSPDNSPTTASEVSGMPLSASTLRTSAATPRAAIIRFRLVAVVNGGL